jgi:DnaJ-class molecular chaperone
MGFESPERKEGQQLEKLWVKCPICNGTGRKNDKPCDKCDGKGQIREDKI